MTQKGVALAAIIAQELKVKAIQVEKAMQLLDEGATVPFIARYRKEATGGLSDTQLRLLTERLIYLRELDERRQVVLASIGEQEKLTSELEERIQAADTKAHLEDLYLPYRPKRRTKAQVAVEAGLEPLAHSLWHNPLLNALDEAGGFINPEAAVVDAGTALEGARHILMEHFSEDAALINTLREHLWEHGLLQSLAAGKKNLDKFADYAKYAEGIKKIPSHRALALLRGRRESVLRLSLVLPEEEAHYGVAQIAIHFNIPENLPEGWLLDTVRATWKLKLFPKLELELLTRLREESDEEAIKVFSRNLRDLLLAAPAGGKTTLGLDPGIRTGVKAAVIDATGKVLDYTVVFPFAPLNDWHGSIAELAKLVMRHEVQLISIGNGTASRETERLVGDLIKMYPDIPLVKAIVSEAGASVYSASETASTELPELDVTIRGAVSIARRIQDPLAELVKIDAKSIGVGQYQHDVNQARLARALNGVVEECVNTVGVDANTASTALLSHIAGLNEALAKNIVHYRDTHGPFVNRAQLRNINRLGDKAFQQAAGFLRISKGDNPLDASCVHPEAYPLVEKIAQDKALDIMRLIGNKEVLHSLQPEHYESEEYGLPTVTDVLRELEKPGRDPRPQFKVAQFKEGVEDITHLQMGMILEGVVSNVTNFGAFVDIGVHQDGLVHISAMTNRFITDPRAVVKPGDIVKVKVIEVDTERRRIGLSMKLENNKAPVNNENKEARQKLQPSREKGPSKSSERRPTNKSAQPHKKPAPPKEPIKKTIFNTAMADALAKLKRGG